MDAASEDGKVGERVFNTVIQNFSRGPVVRVTAAADGTLSDHDKKQLKGVDLAVIVAQPHLQTRMACACDDVGVRAALLMSPINRELVPGDVPDMSLLNERCDKGLRVLGPQSFGLMSPHYELNLTPGLTMALPGSIAFVSQSSAMCSAVLDWSFRTGVGFSAMVACDTMPDLSWPDLIIHFGDDPHTKSIVLCLESASDSRAFLSAAREIALNKPIILLKTRRQADALAGDDIAQGDSRPNAVFDAALRRVGVLRVNSISELFDMANILARQPLPKGPRLAIVTNSITPALLATDTLLASGGSLAQLSDHTLEALADGQIPETVGGNPMLIHGNAPPQAYASALTTLAADNNVDGMLVVFTPQAATEPTATARAIAAVPKKSGKPLLTSWMGADRVSEGREVLYNHGVPSFVYPDAPARLFSLMWLHAQNLNNIYETPTLIAEESRAEADAAKRLLDNFRRDAVTVLSVEQATELLRLYGIELQPDAEVPEDAYKLMVGSRVDKMFGPHMVFGIGGRMSAIYEDVALDLPPLTSALAHRMMQQSAVWRVLRPSGDDDAVATARVGKLQSLLVRLSQMVVQQPAIRRLTINPLLVSGNEVLITNCAVNLQNPSIPDDALPRPAIRPYPTQYIWHETVRNGVQVIFRPVRPEDEPLIVEFHKLLSEDTIYRRYFFQHKLSRRTSHERLRRTCFLDFDREIALAAVLKTEAGTDAIAAVGRLARNRAGDSAEVAMVVADPYQSLGIGTMILRHLVDIGRAEGVARLEGTMLPGNIHMQHLFGKFNFDIHPGEDDTVVAELEL